MKDISRRKLHVDCREPTPTQGTIKLQFIWDNTLMDRAPISVALASKPEVELPVTWDKSSVTVQVDDTEGPFALDLHWKDPFHEIAVQSTRCQYVLDRTAPKVTVSLPDNSGSGSFRMNAGSILKFTAEDLHLDSISYCIRKEIEECTTRVF